jgi:predicted DNA binding CopG/RHH family protein
MISSLLMKAPQLPKTDSIEELARFWDEHDLTDFEDELEEVTEPVFRRSEHATIQIHLPWQELEQLRRLASKAGVDDTTLIQEWIHEKLQAV